MKRLLLSCCILLCVVLTLKAQEQPLISPDDSIRSLVGRLFPNSNPNLSAHMNLQFSTSGVANFIEGDLEDASFKLNRVKLEILGSFSKQFSYHFPAVNVNLSDIFQFTKAYSMEEDKLSNEWGLLYLLND